MPVNIIHSRPEGRTRGKRLYERSAFLMVCILASAFGPYLVPRFGLRLEHFVIYGAFGSILLTMALSGATMRMGRESRWISGLLLACIAWFLFSTLLNAASGGFSAAHLLASFENFTQPVALVFITAWAVSRMDEAQKHRLLQVVFITVILMLCLNTLLCLATVFTDISWVLRPFHGGGSELRGTVHSRAVTMGRYPGIFNQPIESGVAYSIGLVFWLYLAVTTPRIRLAGWLYLALLFVGGVFSVSKAFILGGVPVFFCLWAWYFAERFRFRISTLFGWAVCGALSAAAFVLLARHWQGMAYFMRIFDSARYSERGLIRQLTAGRFGGGSAGGLKAHMLNTWQESPVYGLGAYVSHAIDNAYLEFFHYGGLVGLAFYLAILLVILARARRCYYTHPNLGKLLLGMWILIIGAGMGAPILTLNRVSIFLWVAMVIIFSITGEREDPVPETAPPVRMQGAH